MSNKKNNNEKYDYEDIDKLIDNTFEKIKDLVDANTVIGSPILLGEKMSIIPITKISVGIVSGGGEVPMKKSKKSLNACSTTGFNVTPIGFVSVNNGNIDFINSTITDNINNKLIDFFSNIYDKVVVKNEVASDEEN